LTLGKKRTKKGTGKMVKTSHFEALENGIYYKRGTKDAKVWPWPIFIGKVAVPGLGPEPLRTELVREGKSYKLVFYDNKRGMIGKITLPRMHMQYILKELYSKAESIPVRGKINIDKIGTILYLDQDKLNAMESDAERTMQHTKEVYI